MPVELPIWSYSFLNDYSICPSRAWHKYVAKDTVYVSAPAAEWGDLVHKAFDARISSGRKLPDTLTKFEHWPKAFDGLPVRTELRAGVRQDGTPCGFYDADCYGHMKIDLVYEPGDGTARLFDWKTGKVREDPFELQLQALFVQAINPALRVIRGWYVWLGQGAAGELGAPHECDVERTWAEVDSMMHTIRLNAGNNYWPTREGPMCGYCNAPCKFNKQSDLRPK